MTDTDKGGLHIDEKIVGLSISQWLPCPFAIWNLVFGMAILLNLVKVFKIVNGYEDIDRNIFFKFKEGSRTRGHKAALVKE